MSDEKKIISAEGELRLLSDKKNLRQKVELRLLNGMVNRNNWRYDNIEENAKRANTGIADTPILCAYVGNKIGDGHNFQMTRDEEGNEVADFREATAERMVGYVRDLEDVRMEIIDGIEWLVATGTIFTWYAAQLVEKLKETGALSVSIETLIDEMHYEGNVEVFTKYTFLGTTILGEDVAPAVKSANIKALSAIGVDEMRKLTLKVASADEKAKTDPQKKNTKGVKKVMRVKDVQASFSGYTVLDVSENNVALLSDNGTLHLSTAEKDGDNIIVGAKVEAASVTVLSAGDTKMEIPTETVIEKLNARAVELETALNESKKREETLTNTIGEMQKAENKRRANAIKAAIKARIAENAKISGGCIAENECDDMLADDKVQEFVEIVDENGDFCGDKAACDKVDARCMQKMREEAEKRENAQKNNSFSWNSFAGKDDSEQNKKGGEDNPLDI